MRITGRRLVPSSLFLSISLATTACTSLHVDVSKPTPLPVVIQQSSAFAASQGQYTLTPGDQITVRFYYNPQLDEDLLVRPDGNISLSLIGEIPASGKTPGQLSADVTDAYSQFFKKSTAVVLVRQFNMQRIFISGEVKNPGQFNLLTSAHTALEGLSVAGGVTDNGTLTHVILVRHLPQQPQLIVTELNLAAALGGKDPTQDVALLPEDMIYVPKSNIADFNLAIHEYLYNNLNLSTSATLGTTRTLQ